MIEVDVGKADVIVAFLEKFEAEINVIKRYGKAFFKAAHFFKSFPAAHEAGGGDGGAVVDVLVGDVAVSGEDAATEDDTAVLDGVVGVKEGCADGSDAGALGLFEEGFDPVGGNNFSVVVEEEKVVAGGNLGSLVIEVGKVKGNV